MEKQKRFVPNLGIPRVGGGYQMPMVFRCKFCYKYESTVSDLVMIYESPTQKFFAHKTCIEKKQPIRYEPYKNQEQEPVKSGVSTDSAREQEELGGGEGKSIPHEPQT